MKGMTNLVNIHKERDVLICEQGGRMGDLKFYANVIIKWSQIKSSIKKLIQQVHMYAIRCQQMGKTKASFAGNNTNLFLIKTNNQKIVKLNKIIHL